MPTYKTPGVYVEEKPALPPTVAEVPTAIPAFIGYTEKARKDVDDDLLLRPAKIHSLLDYEAYFGKPKDDPIVLSIAGAPGGGFALRSFTEPDVTHLMWYSLRMFFDNGGGPCYVVSVGRYQSAPVIELSADPNSSPPTRGGLLDGLNALANTDEPTLIVIPEATQLLPPDYQVLVRAALAQCAALGDRFAILDLFDGGRSLDASVLATNRGYFGSDHLQFGAAYYPFLRTAFSYHVNDAETNVSVAYNSGAAATLDTYKTTNPDLYQFVRSVLQDHVINLPPSGAVAGAYAATDTSRGVWKAPANVRLASVFEPVVKVSDAMQARLNVDYVTGKSINAIRAFAGKGVLVWGARTLAGNDNDWRYVNVRRFFIAVEESLKKSTAWAVFEPNDASTWTKIRGMTESYLIQQWRAGALAGATPRDAFFVRCGLGDTMTAQDILEGRLNVEVGMAAVRPAEFIILKFSHKLPTSQGSP